VLRVMGGNPPVSTLAPIGGLTNAESIPNNALSTDDVRN
jgi:hypothetical protein